MTIARYKTAALVTALAASPYVATETEVGQQTIQTVSSYVGTPAPISAGPTYAPGISPDQEHQARGYGMNSMHQIEKLRNVNADRYRYDPDLARRLGALPQDESETPTLSGEQIHDLREILRFDIGPEWVIQRFARVSTVLADMNLKGLRVPVVTGIRADDVAGTLTFYFDSTDRLQRLTFHGFTGDATRFTNVMVSYYGLQREPALEAGTYTKRWNGRPVHFMRLSHAPVVYSDAVHQKYTVFLELNQPDLAYGISNEARKIVLSERQAGRW